MSIKGGRSDGLATYNTPPALDNTIYWYEYHNGAQPLSITDIIPDYYVNQRARIYRGLGSVRLLVVQCLLVTSPLAKAQGLLRLRTSYGFTLTSDGSGPTLFFDVLGGILVSM